MSVFANCNTVARRLLIPAIITFCLAPVSFAHAANSPLPRSTPEAQGISSRAILDFVQGVDKNVNTPFRQKRFMIVRYAAIV